MHNEEVRAYFGDSDDFLEFSIEEGDGWEKLCRFLDKPVPNVPFPHKNKGLHFYNRRDKALKVIRDIAPAGLRRALFSIRLLLRKIRRLPDPRDRFHNLEANRRSRSD